MLKVYIRSHIRELSRLNLLGQRTDSVNPTIGTGHWTGGIFLVAGVTFEGGFAPATGGSGDTEVSTFNI